MVKKYKQTFYVKSKLKWLINMKRYSNSQAVMEIKIKLKMRNDFTLIRLAKILKRVLKFIASRDMGKGILSYNEG